MSEQIKPKAKNNNVAFVVDATASEQRLNYLFIHGAGQPTFIF